MSKGVFVEKERELDEIMRAVAEAGLRLLSNAKPPDFFPLLFDKYLRITTDFQNVLTLLLTNPEPLQKMQAAYWQDAIGLSQDLFHSWLKGTPKPSSDKRFRSEEWLDNPFFNLLSQQYLLASEHINLLLNQLDYHDEKLAQRVRFFTRQYLDALSPDNYFHTNPQLIAETIKSHGKNLLLGLQNLLADIESESSTLLIKMTDMHAFKVGVNIAVTPGKVIYRNDLMELIQYTPDTPKVRSLPLLIIPPWINKYYILDLSPNDSLVRWLVSQGITVFIISWVNPDKTFAEKGLYDYLNEGPIAAIGVIKKQLGIKKVNALGFCIGGTLLSMLLAYYKAKKQNPIRSATLLASMIDFSDPGDIAVFIDEEQVTRLEEKMKRQGFLEGHFMASAFNSLRASDLIWSFFIRNYLRGKPPVPFDILYWNSDTTNMPAKMHSEYLRWMYLQNDLVKPNKIQLNGTPLDLSQIDTPTFFVSTIKDHIAPWKTTYLGYQLVKGKKRYLLGGSGHIAGIIIPPGTEKYGFYRQVDPKKTANAWLKSATFHTGSWWPEWFDWLTKQSGKQIDAPCFKNLPIKPLMDAPGTYVLVTSKEFQHQINELF